MVPLPPSRKDPIGPPGGADPLSQALRQQGSYLRSLDPGVLGGRFATPQPLSGKRVDLVGGGDLAGNESSVYEWEWNDRHTCASASTQTVSLTHVPVEESLVVRWHEGGMAFGNGVRLISEQFVVDSNTVVIPNPGPISSGDVFSFQYQFDPDLMAEPAPVFFGFVGYETAEGTSVTSVPLPDGVIAGDLLVLIGISDSVASSSDPRLTGSASFGGDSTRVARWGDADSSGSPISVNISGSGGCAVLMAWRGAGSVTASSIGTAVVSPVTTMPTFPSAEVVLGLLLTRTDSPLFWTEQTGDNWLFGTFSRTSLGSGTYDWFHVAAAVWWPAVFGNPSPSPSSSGVFGEFSGIPGDISFLALKIKG